MIFIGLIINVSLIWKDFRKQFEVSAPSMPDEIQQSVDHGEDNNMLVLEVRGSNPIEPGKKINEY